MYDVAVERAGREVSSISTHTSMYKDNWKGRYSNYSYTLCISSNVTDGLRPWFHENRLI